MSASENQSKIRLVVVLVFVIGLVAALAVAVGSTIGPCARNGAAMAPPPDPQKHDPPPKAVASAVELTLVADGLSEPLYLTSPPGDSERVFIVEKTGKVRILQGGAVFAGAYLDLASRVSRGSEQGLLSIAFHPKYAENGRVYAYFTDRRGHVRVIELTRSDSDPDRVDPATEREIILIEQPFSNHNGGHAFFGPDGYLYLGIGDGGSAGDPYDNAQRLDTLLGKMLRIDVDVERPVPARKRAYTIPEDNPFAKRKDARPEIWAYGLRNPWRNCFDSETGDLYMADVGQDRWEEIHVAPAGSRGGENYGWNIEEGSQVFRPRGRARTGLEKPVVEYGHPLGCSVTGGYVYRGRELAKELAGCYFYADYCTGLIRSFRLDPEDRSAKDLWDWTSTLNPEGRGQRKDLSSFGEDAAGELYLLSLDGRVFRLSRRKL